MKDLDIGVVAQQSGLTTATLRYYERRGLIQSSGRNGLRRLYDPGVLSVLSLILLGQRAGFSLDEIKEILGEGGETRIPTDILLQKADEIDRLIAQLKMLKDGLRHVADCPEPSHSQCPKFQRIMKIALARKRDRRKPRGVA